jgi:hypothetical protein
MRDNEDDHSDQQSVSEGKDESLNLIKRYTLTSSSSTVKLLLIKDLRIQSEWYKHYRWDFDFEMIKDNEDDHSD